MRVVGGGQDDGVDPEPQQVAVVGHDRHALGQEPPGALDGVRGGVGRDHEPGRHRRGVRERGQVAAGPDADDTDPQLP